VITHRRRVGEAPARGPWRNGLMDLDVPAAGPGVELVPLLQRERP
jgi:hypothetical protein